ncbi:MAG: hypothetical protein A2161_10825 [Candidatus Schekmanbacteria bacterium RBG_13_48_7]|uniref:CheW-like domain-containing protein n=1 Tax=Candidatus Schekmanbacteria bacterium RBG_13_48_7 TaxID=1817878 RepID=A0A1F7RQT3_9BACT|nr:MAG: hypothetical protein A2161_10825 [Candidatus Schekmanbacteria bacterium RBG_13_48_7]
MNIEQVETSEQSVNLDNANPIFNDVTQKAQVLIFKVHEERFGLEIKYIQRIDSLGTITPMPKVPDFMEGIINLRGTITTLIEFSKFSSKSSKSFLSPSHIIVLQNERMNLGLIVEMIYDVIYIPIHDLQEDENLPADVVNSYIKCIVRVQDKIINIVHAERIFREIEELDFNQFEDNSE